MAADKRQIRFKKDSRAKDAPTLSIEITLDELISTTKEREKEALENLFDPSKRLDQNQSIEFQIFGINLKNDKTWGYYKKEVLDPLKLTESSIILYVRTTVQQETKKSASFVEPTKAPFGVPLSQSSNPHLFRSKKEEKKPLPDNEQNNEDGLSEEPSDAIDPMEPPLERKSSCNII